MPEAPSCTVPRPFSSIPLSNCLLTCTRLPLVPRPSLQIAEARRLELAAEEEQRQEEEQQAKVAEAKAALARRIKWLKKYG